MPPASSRSAKRTYDLLQEGIRTAGPNGTSKKARIAMQPADAREVFDAFINQGKAFPRLIHPFRPVAVVMNAGQLSPQQQTHDPSGAPFPEKVAADNKANAALYLTFVQRLPGGEGVMQEYRSNDFTKFDNLSALIQTEAHQARANDTKALKFCMRYIKQSPTDIIPDTVRSSKAHRGFNSEITGALLVPMKHWEQYVARTPDGERLRKEFHDRTKKPTARQWPAFVYESPTEYDPGNIGGGLLRGRLLILVGRHLLFGPHAADDPEEASQKCIAAKLHLQSVTPAFIAYTAAQARFMISSSTSWRVNDNGFSLDSFYCRIITLFQTSTEAWRKETIDWWQSQIFSSPDSQSYLDESDFPIDDDEEDEDALFHAQQVADSSDSGEHD